MYILDTLIQEAKLTPRQLAPSQILLDRQTVLVKLLPSWQKAKNSDIFAENFFWLIPLDLLKKQTVALFDKAGKILNIGAMIPENQLRGYFIMQGQKTNIEISFTLTPENPPLIQTYAIAESEK